MIDRSRESSRESTQIPRPNPVQGSLREPHVYEFVNPYKNMYDDLRREDPELYRRNGILPMLKRNSVVKTAHRRCEENAADGWFDVVFTFEEVFDMVIEGIDCWEDAIDDIVPAFEMQHK